MMRINIIISGLLILVLVMLIAPNNNFYRVSSYATPQQVEKFGNRAPEESRVLGISFENQIIAAHEISNPAHDSADYVPASASSSASSDGGSTIFNDPTVHKDESEMKAETNPSFMKLATVGMPWRSPTQSHNTSSLYQQIVENATAPTSFEILEKIIKYDDEDGRQEYGIGNWTAKTKQKYLPLCMVPNISRTDALVDSVVRGESLHLPVLNMGFPKEGSTTLLDFFRCAGFKASHSQAGDMAQKRAQKGLAPLDIHAPKHYEAMTQLDVNFPPKSCFYPQIQLLDEIHHAKPNATFVLNFRPIGDWINSVQHWSGMRQRLTQCDLPGFREGIGHLDEEMASFHCSHVEHVREFVAQHPSHALIELDLYDSDRSRRVMSALFNASSSCWGHSNENPKIGQKNGKHVRRRLYKWP